MTQEALKLALDWAEAHGEIVFAGGGMSAVNKMNSWVAAIKEALAQEKALQALHSENERLGLYKDAYAQPEQEPVAWRAPRWSNLHGEYGYRDFNDPVIDISTGKPSLHNEPLYLTPPQRTWVRLTDDEHCDIWYKESLDWMEYGKAIEAKLKEKNCAG